MKTFITIFSALAIWAIATYQFGIFGFFLPLWCVLSIPIVLLILAFFTISKSPKTKGL